jgi:hypothetical protein
MIWTMGLKKANLRVWVTSTFERVDAILIGRRRRSAGQVRALTLVRAGARC